MKQLLLLSSLIVSSHIAIGQWQSNSDGVYYDQGSVTIGINNSQPRNSTSHFFPGVKPLLEVNSYVPGSYENYVLIKNPSHNSTATLRRLGLMFKLSHEGSVGEALKMGGLVFESSRPWANHGSLHLVTYDKKRLSITYDGNVGIGTTNPGSFKLAVEGKIGAREIQVTTASWADFVFLKNYRLRSLYEVEEFIAENGHLPEIPSAKEVEENGINLGEMDAKLLQKIEELTLYMIEQNKKIESLYSEIEKLKN